MISLAAGGGDFVFLAVMLVFGLLNWLAKKGKEEQPKAPAKASRPPRPAPSAPGETSEEERMRRFLEALGVPSDAPPPPVAVPPSLPPRPPRAQPRPIPQPKPRPAPVHSLDEADAPTEAYANLHLPELRTPEMPAFETVSSRVSADDDGAYVTVSGAVSAVPGSTRLADLKPADRETGPAVLAIRAALHSRADLRTALILREILGPPRSMQS